MRYVQPKLAGRERWRLFADHGYKVGSFGLPDPGFAYSSGEPARQWKDAVGKVQTGKFPP
jgi:hypothetical protein